MCGMRRNKHREQGPRKWTKSEFELFEPRRVYECVEVDGSVRINAHVVDALNIIVPPALGLCVGEREDRQRRQRVESAIVFAIVAAATGAHAFWAVRTERQRAWWRQRRRW